MAFVARCGREWGGKHLHGTGCGLKAAASAPHVILLSYYINMPKFAVCVPRGGVWTTMGVSLVRGALQDVSFGACRPWLLLSWAVCTALLLPDLGLFPSVSGF